MESPLAVLADERLNRGHRTLAEKAFETLHTAIITGQLRLWREASDRRAGGVLQMSPMPIREAVRRLDTAGLVENIPHRWAWGRVVRSSAGPRRTVARNQMPARVGA